jgi:uncharacterized protein
MNLIRSIKLETKSSAPKRFGEWVIKYRWLVILASVIITMIAGYGGQYLGFNNDYRVFFSDENPQLKAFDALQKVYTKDDNLFIVIESKEGDVFKRETLAAIEELVEKSWKAPFASRVDAITNFQYTYADGDDLYVEDLAKNAKGFSNEKLAKIKDITLNEPLLKDRLISKDARITGVNITVKLPGKVPGEEMQVVAFGRQLAKEFEERNPKLKTYLTGLVMLSGAFGESAQYDMSTLIPLMFLIVIVTIFITLRSISSVFVSVLVLFLSIITAMGIAGWIGIQLTAPSMSAPTMILTLAVADSIHILVTVLQQIRAGKKKNEAIIESIRINLMPVFITSLTTVIGFLTMNFSDAPPFQDLGNITAIGVTAALFFSVFMLPALLSVLPLKVKAKADNGKNKFIDNLASFIIRNNKKLLWSSSAIILIVASLSFQNDLNDEFVKYFDERIQFRKDTDFLSENLTGIYTIEFSLGTGTSGGINNPEYLKKLDAFKSFYEKQENVIHVNSFSEVASRINKSMHGDNKEYYRVPDKRDEAAQYLLLYEMSLPYGLDLNNQIDVDKSASRFIVTVENMPTKELIALTQKGENWLKENTDKTMFSNGISTAIMFSHLSQRQIDSMMSGTAVAILLISLVLVLALRSFKFGALSILPNISPVMVGFGFWGVTVGQIDSGLAMVFGMTLGIVVDDTVHFLSKYLRARREHGSSPEEAVRYAFNTVGMAIIVTSIVLVAGFLVLAQSSFGLNSGMGKMTAIIIATALVIDFLMLPPLLIRLAKDDKKQNESKSEKNMELIS